MDKAPTHIGSMMGPGVGFPILHRIMFDVCRLHVREVALPQLVGAHGCIDMVWSDTLVEFHDTDRGMMMPFWDMSKEERFDT